MNIERGAAEGGDRDGCGGSHMVGPTEGGTRAFTANIFAGSVTELDLVKKEVVEVISVGPRSEGVAVAPDESTVWVAATRTAPSA